MRALLTVLFFGLALTISTSGCTKKEDPRLANTLKLWMADEIRTLDPASAYDSVSDGVLWNIVEALYQYDYLSAPLTLIPSLAADFPTYSKDRLTLTIPIKKGIRFQDDPCFKETQGKGRELKAKDFVFALKRLAHPKIQSQGWWILDGRFVGINTFRDRLAKTTQEESARLFEDNLEGIQAIDDYTLQFKLTRPYPQLLFVLAMHFASPVASEAVAAYADESGRISQNPVGTGPFVLKQWERGRKVVLEKNPNFRPDFYPLQGAKQYEAKGMLTDAGKLLPFIDGIHYQIVKEAQPAWLRFLQGGFDLMSIPKDNFEQTITNGKLNSEMQAKGIRLDIDEALTFRYLGMNVKDKLLSNKYLRQAISSSFDRDRWITIFANGRGKKMTTILPPGVLDRPENTRLKYDFDLERAKALLAKAGYPGGKGLPPLRFDLGSADTVTRQLADFFVQQFSAAGIKTEVIFNTFPAYLEKQHKGDLQLSLDGWNLDYPDAENGYQLLYGPNRSPGANHSSYDNPEFNRLYEKMSVLPAGPERAALIQKMDNIIQEDCPWAFGYYPTRYLLAYQKVHNYRMNDIIRTQYRYVRLK